MNDKEKKLKDRIDKALAIDPTKAGWAVVMAHNKGEIGTILLRGFEPFAADCGYVYFRKKVK